MSESRADIAIKQALSEQSKFDYFIISIATATCAYLVNHWAPSRLGINHQTLQIISISLIGYSVFSGIMSLRLRVSHRFAEGYSKTLAENLNELGEVKIQKNHGQNIILSHSSEPLTINDINKLQDNTKSQKDHVDSQIESFKSKDLFWFKSRDYSLLLGVILYFISKIMSAY